MLKISIIITYKKKQVPEQERNLFDNVHARQNTIELDTINEARDFFDA